MCAVGLLLAGLCLVYEFREMGGAGPTLDDTFIHLQFARNLAHGHGFSFNPGEPLPGATAPLWVLLLTPLAFGSKQVLVQSSIVLSVLSYLAAGVLAYGLARRIELGRGLSLLAGGLVLANGRMLWAGMSGMETDLFAALSLAGFILYLKDMETGRMRLLTAAVFGAASLARPEGYLLFAGVLVHYLLALREKKTSTGRDLLFSLPIVPVLLYIGLILPYMVFSLVTIGHPLPGTFLAKQADFSWYRESYIRFTAVYLFLGNPAVALFFLAAIGGSAYRILRERLSFPAGKDALLLGWPVGYLAVSAALTPMPFHFCRYQIPVLPFIIISALLSAKFITRKAQAADSSGEGVWRRRATYALYAVFIGGAVIGHVGFQQGRSVLRWAEVTANSADNINSLHVRLGKWLHRSTDKEALVATQDIGAMGYYSERRILDLVGLVTPEVVPYVSGKGSTVERSRDLYRFLQKKKPDYLVIFPALYPGLTENRPVFTPVQIITIPDNQVAAGNRMVLFRCRWGAAGASP
ncbi:MAG: hypothetical protein R6V10_10730 [bacterium]